MKKLQNSSFFKFLLVLFILNLFFISISLLGAFKGDGKEFAKSLLTNFYQFPLLGLLTGILVTSIMQSSSATTSIVVSFVATGFFGSNIELALYGAIPIIMGANIGTSITNTIVAIGHIGDIDEFKKAFSAATVHDIFNFLAVIIFFPLQVYTNFLGKISLFVAKLFLGGSAATFKSPIKALIKPQVHFIQKLAEFEFVSKIIVFFVFSFILMILLKMYFKYLNASLNKSKLLFYIIIAYLTIVFSSLNTYADFILASNIATFLLGLLILFSSLNVFVKIMKNLTSSKLELLFNNYVFKTPIRAFLVGIIITAIVQSSSVTTSVIVPLAGAGILNIYQIFPYTLGANIGTTITALLAAISLGSIGAISVAFSHLFFNIFGICLIFPFRKIPILISQKFANIAIYSKIIPVFIILLVYFIIPLTLILIFK